MRDYEVSFSLDVWESRFVWYSASCFSCSYCLGCVGLRSKSYCICNKQYTESEYFALAGRIIEHMQGTLEWGEFFPTSISPFGYNETIASTYTPLSRETALARGFRWSDYEAPAVSAARVIPANRLLNWAIECEVTGKPFRIVPQELAFYRRHHIPIPRRHPDQRFLDRMSLRNPRKLYHRACAKCHQDTETSYAPERPEVVYCETCYDWEVYG